MEELRVLLLAEYDRRVGGLRRGPSLRLANPPPGVRYFTLPRTSIYEAPLNYSGVTPSNIIRSAVAQLTRALRPPVGEGFDLVHDFFMDLTRISSPWVHENDESPGQYLSEYFNMPAAVRSAIVGTIIDRLNDDNCRAVITWSKWAYEGFVRDGVPASKVYVVPPPMMLGERRPHSTVNVLLVARDPLRKGLDVALKAFARTLKYLKDVVLIAIGPDATRIAKASGLRGLVAFNRVDDFTLHNVIMPETDIVLAPSRAEAYNLTVLEAMAHGAVPIVTDVGALPELVGDAGIVVERDDVLSLSDSLERLASDEGLRSKLSAAAREVVRRDHDPEVVGERLLKVYMSALEG